MAVAGDRGAVSGAWRPWTIAVAGGLAVTWCAALIAVDLGGLIMGSWDTPQRGLGWIRADLGANTVLAAVAAGALLGGLAAPARRPGAVIVAVAVIPVGFGLFLLAAHLAASAA